MTMTMIIAMITLSPFIVMLHLTIEETLSVLLETIKEYKLYVLWVGLLFVGIVSVYTTVIIQDWVHRPRLASSSVV
jgi:hypothetical protein